MELEAEVSVIELSDRLGRRWRSLVESLGLLVIVGLLSSCLGEESDRAFAKAFGEIREGNSKEQVLRDLARWQFVGGSPIVETGSPCGLEAVERQIFRSSETGLTGVVSVDKEGIVRCVALLSPMRKYG